MPTGQEPEAQKQDRKPTFHKLGANNKLDRCEMCFFNPNECDNDRRFVVRIIDEWFFPVGKNMVGVC